MGIPIVLPPASHPVVTLAKLLRIPPGDEKEDWRMAWRRLTEGDTLFRSLRAAVKDETAPGAVELAGAWGACAEKARLEAERSAGSWDDSRLDSRLFGRFARDLTAVTELADCARRAWEHRGLSVHEIEPLCRQIWGDSESTDPKIVTRKTVGIRLLLGEEPPTVTVPVALMLGETGYLADLTLGLLKNAAGPAVPHPGDCFCTAVESDFYGNKESSFSDSMDVAWQAAQAVSGVPAEGEAPVAGFWRIRLRDGEPVLALEGESAGGAAARGWLDLLMGKVPDDRVIALCTTDARGNLGGFLGHDVFAKVTAIAEEGYLDTIVVVDPDDKAAAEDALLKEGKDGEIRVLLK